MLGDDGGKELTPLDPGWYTELGLSKDFKNVLASGFLQQPLLAMRTAPQGQVWGLLLPCRKSEGVGGLQHCWFSYPLQYF